MAMSPLEGRRSRSHGHHPCGTGNRVAHRLGQAFRQCAITERRLESWLGAKHRYQLAHMEKARTIKATAHEIARLVYAMLRDGTAYVERPIADFEKAHQDRKIAHIRRQAHVIGCVLASANIGDRITKVLLLFHGRRCPSN